MSCLAVVAISTFFAVSRSHALLFDVCRMGSSRKTVWCFFIFFFFHSFILLNIGWIIFDEFSFKIRLLFVSWVVVFFSYKFGFWNRNIFSLNSFLKNRANCDEIQYKPVLRVAGQLYLPFTVVALVILLIAFCCIRRCCRKRRPKDAKKGLKGAVDLKSVQLLGNAYKEKVNFDYYIYWFFGGLEFNFLFIIITGSTGYGWTDWQRGRHCRRRWKERRTEIGSIAVQVGIRFQPEQFGRHCPSGWRVTRTRHGWNIRSLCQSLPPTGQEEEIRNQSPSQNSQSCF